MADVVGIILLAVFVVGYSWIFDGMLPEEMRDWSQEPIEDNEPTAGDATDNEIEERRRG